MSEIGHTVQPMGHGSTIVGLVGEYLARYRLQQAGWHVPDEDWKSGATKDLDLIATSPTGAVRIEVQVKSTTTGQGWIRWQKRGRENVDAWIAQASARGAGAVFILIHGDEASVSLEPNEARGGFFVPTPKLLQMTGMTAQSFGNLVDERRAEYGMRPRRRQHPWTRRRR